MNNPAASLSYSGSQRPRPENRKRPGGHIGLPPGQPPSSYAEMAAGDQPRPAGNSIMAFADQMSADRIQPVKPGLMDVAEAATTPATSQGMMTNTMPQPGISDNPIDPLSPGIGPYNPGMHPYYQQDMGGNLFPGGGSGTGNYQTIMPPAPEPGGAVSPPPSQQPAFPPPQGQSLGGGSSGGRFSYNYTGPTSGSNVSAQSVAPTVQEVDQNQLMSYHLNNILDHDSDFMRRAAQMGIDRAAGRGLGNSSIAAGNAMGSMIDRAMPIAGFDAGRYGRVGDLNQQSTNMVNMANADRSLQASMANQQMSLGWAQFNHGTQMDQWNAQRGDRALDANLYQGMFGSYFNALGGIYNNPNLTAEQQNAAAQNLGDMFPGFANQAWGAIPPDLLSGPAIPAAQMMPPMGPQTPPMFPGPVQP